ncbi:nucleotidyltransferase domain-containing protein [Bradyrhizobium sp. IC3123]|nr:nucleotidyltransferase domain-containing protein [Bradyrhizobium sp. IC3123]
MTESKTKLDVLTTRLAKARHLKAFEHLTIYAAGSYGRLEASKYSDIDLFFVLANTLSAQGARSRPCVVRALGTTAVRVERLYQRA